MKKVAALVVTLLVAAGLVVPGMSPAAAQPNSLSPGNGGSVTVGSESFSWFDNDPDSARAWYVEISTSPSVDYYPQGFFSGSIVFANQNLLLTPSLNLGSTLAPGTYYWHVLGRYGLCVGYYGCHNTGWSPVQSFIVRANTPAPHIDVSPTSFHFTVQHGDASLHTSSAAVSNTGGGTLHFNAAPNSSAPQWLSLAAGSNTGLVYTMPVRVSASGLAVGSYNNFFRVWDNGSSPASSNAFQDVQVTLVVTPSDAAAPTGSSISITGDAYTTSPAVDLVLSASDSGAGMGEMRFDNNDNNWSQWQPYATTKTWQLPTADGPRTVRAQFRDNIGNTASPVSATVILDRTAPSRPALVAPAISTTLAATTSVVLRWTGGADAGSGLASRQLRSRALPSGAWSSWTIRTGSAATLPGAAGVTYEYQMRSVDRAGNVSTVSTARSSVPFDQVSATFGGAWSNKSQSGAFRGTVKRTTKRNAAAWLSRRGRVLGVLVTTGPGRSGAAIYVDNRFVKAINTLASSTHVRVYVPVTTYATAALHTVKIVNFALPSRPALEVDGIVIGQ